MPPALDAGPEAPFCKLEAPLRVEAASEDASSLSTSNPSLSVVGRSSAAAVTVVSFLPVSLWKNERPSATAQVLEIAGGTAVEESSGVRSPASSYYSSSERRRYRKQVTYEVDLRSVNHHIDRLVTRIIAVFVEALSKWDPDFALSGMRNHLGPPSSGLCTSHDQLDASQIALVVHSLHKILESRRQNGEEDGHELERR